MTAAIVLTVVSGLAATGAAGTGGRAAWLWYRASIVQPNPDWGPTQFEPVDPMQSAQSWIVAQNQAAAEAGALNAQAARWTAAAVVCAAFQSAAGFLASAFA